MKRLPRIIQAAAFLLAAFSFYIAKSSSELVYDDVKKLIEGCKRTKVEKAEFEKKANQLKADHTSLMSNRQIITDLLGREC